MKRMLNKAWRSVLATVLVFTLVLGTCGTAFAATTKEEASKDANAIVADIETLVADIMNDEELKNKVVEIYNNEELRGKIAEVATSEELAQFLAENPEVITACADAYAFVTDENVEANIEAIARANGVDEAYINEVKEIVAAAKDYNGEGREVLVDKLADVIVYLENEVLPELKRIAAEVEAYYYNELIPALEAKLAQLEKDLQDAADEVKAAIEAEIAKVKAEIARVKAEVEALIAKIEAAIAAVEKAINALCTLNAALENLVEVIATGDFANLNAAVEEVQAALNGVAEAITCTEDAIAALNAEIDAAQAFVAGVVDAVVAFNAAVEEAIATVKATVIAINTAVEEAIATAIATVEAIIELAQWIYTSATTAYYPTEGSVYVALGDDSALSADAEYAELVAKELKVELKQHADADGTIADVIATVTEAAEDIAAAELITIGFSANAILETALADMQAGFDGDWVALVGAEAAAAIEAKIAELAAELDPTVAPLATALVESFAYNYVELVVTFPTLIEEIRTVNEFAQILVVGMYNPLADVVVDGIALGEYVEYLTGATNLYFKGYALAATAAMNFVTYVDAPEVATDVEMTNFADVKKFAMYMVGAISKYYPNAEGHEYIKDQILDVFVEVPVETVLFGDANMDGEVDVFDAVCILDYAVGTEVEIDLVAADVDANGEVDVFDAAMILDYAVGNVTVFPAVK